MNYDAKIIERGRLYYRNNLVKYCIKYKNFLFGEVVGSDVYKVKVDLDNNYFGLCTCPYKYNCKHAYALIEAYKNNNYIDAEEIFKELENKSKEEILDILKNLVVKHYLWDEFLDKDSLLNKAISLIKLIPLERKNIHTFKSFLRNQFVKNADDEELVEVIEEMIKADLDFNDSNVIEALTIILDEIFKRENKEVVKKLINLYRKYKKELWIVGDYLIEFYDNYFEY
ncbi:SWIM zinc finger family protein [Methanocaldococcus fervens]|uniref:Zinc finger SWIM domain protein n=1 Tax=Methanocaldococcus fervens (strain DSM 4213 / JCM 15782 / AG86) TaxID=573064 RepID=C7P827_METFA|nr:SWIM zinc finger family protein [Methanocaldococcus fervens]ACV24709.1 zinc finger SWIM domain protein [Methanocaldococcus fervens AG86]